MRMRGGKAGHMREGRGGWGKRMLNPLERMKPCQGKERLVTHNPHSLRTAPNKATMGSITLCSTLTLSKSV